MERRRRGGMERESLRERESKRGVVQTERGWGDFCGWGNKRGN